MKSKIRVVITDDQALFREGLHTLLTTQDDIDVVAEAANGQEAVKLCREHHANVVLMDLRMPIMDGVAATREISKTNQTCRVIILTTFNDDEYIFDGLKAGAVGYLLKDASAEELFGAIRVVANGQLFLQPTIATRVVAELNRLSSKSLDADYELIVALSERELEILRLIAVGASNKEIAAHLYIVEGTVKNHITSILGKLGVSDRTQAALLARERKLI
jgi:DNA-binding NarL/FixJ family response regulator